MVNVFLPKGEPGTSYDPGQVPIEDTGNPSVQLKTGRCSPILVSVRDHQDIMYNFTDLIGPQYSGCVVPGLEYSQPEIRGCSFTLLAISGMRES